MDLGPDDVGKRAGTYAVSEVEELANKAGHFPTSECAGKRPISADIERNSLSGPWIREPAVKSKARGVRGEL
jgi:hypothetical protein